MAFVALKRLKIGNSYREPGEPVPEANGWKTWRSLVAAGHLAGAPDDISAEDGPAKPEKKKPNYANLDVAKLKSLAAKKGLEIEGSGKGGRVLKADLVDALEAS